MVQRALVPVQLRGHTVWVGLAISATVGHPCVCGPDYIHDHHAPYPGHQAACEAGVFFEFAACGGGHHVRVFVPGRDVALRHRCVARHEASGRHTQIAKVHAALIPAVARPVLAVAAVVVVAVRASRRQHVRRVALNAAEDRTLHRYLVLKFSAGINFLER